MHLLVAISGHGYGHMAQLLPILQRIHHHHPEVRITLRTPLPRRLLAEHLGFPFDYGEAQLDLGLAMVDAVEVAVEASWREHLAFHRDWEARLAAEVAWLRAQRVDRVLADVPYLTLAAAKRAGIGALALCSLNWADLFEHYCGDRPAAAEIVGTMREAYASAEWFLQPQPSMPMAWLPNRRAIAPLARLGRNRRAEIDVKLGLGGGERLVPVALGGIPTRLPVERWPGVKGVHYLVPPEWGVARADIHPWDRLDLPFIDLLCSSDALIAKPGYGTFAEAACNGVPLLYLPRGDWPEEPHLVAWLEAHGRARPITREVLEEGALEAPLAALFDLPAGVRPTADGARECVEILRL
ncbi:glycosyltransferase family protein [Endothiovibrio diazotrophicus]